MRSTAPRVVSSAEHFTCSFLLSVFLNTLLSHHHYFPKALVEESHLLRVFSDELAMFLVYYKSKLS